MNSLPLMPAWGLPLTWQVAIGVSVIALLWGATGPLPARPRPGRVVVGYNVAALSGWLAIVAHFSAPQWHVAEPLAALAALTVMTMLREIRSLLADEGSDEDDSGEDDSEGEGPDLPTGGGGLSVDWDVFERQAHRAWAEHHARERVYV